MKDFFKDKEFFKTLGFIVIPIIFQELLNSSVNFVDIFMIGQIGEVAVTSVSLANQIFFIFNYILFGINSGASVFIGQYWGKNDLNGIYKIIGIGMILSLCTAGIFSFGALFMPKALMSLYSKDILVINEGVKYLKIIGISYFFTAFVMGINASLRAIKLTKYPMFTTFISLIVNIFLNYIFIFKLNFGVVGASLATLCARTVELLIQTLIIFKKKVPFLTKLKNYLKFDKQFLSMYFKVLTPVIINELLWSLGTSMYNVAYKFSGTNAQASVQISNSVQNVFTVIGVSVGTGCSILLSNLLGAGNKEKSLIYSKKCKQLALFFSFILSLILILSIPFIISLFNVPQIVKSYSQKILLIVSVSTILKTCNYLNIIGILRSGGDTKFTLILEGSTIWFIGVPMAFLGSYFLQLPIYLTFFLVMLEEVIKLILGSIRVKKEVWLKTLV